MSLHFFAAHKIVTAVAAAVLAAGAWIGARYATHTESATVSPAILAPVSLPAVRVVPQASPTNQSVSGLKDYVDRRFEALERLLDERRISSQTAIDKSDIATDKRFELSNEVRAQLEVQAATFVTKVEFQNLKQTVESLETQSNVTRGIVIAIGVMFGIFKWYTGRNPPTRRIADIIPPRPPE